MNVKTPATISPPKVTERRPTREEAEAAVRTLLLWAYKAYGAWGVKKMYGRESEGTLRSTFVIDARGHVAAAWPSVKVAGHVEKVLAFIENELA